MLEMLDDIDDDLEEEFNKAAEYLQTIVEKLDQGTLLELYGLYKQAITGNCNIPKPGMFSIQAKAKWTAWNNLKDMPKAQAMANYIEKMTAICPQWNATTKKSKDQQWVSVSQHIIGDDDVYVPESDKTAFDFVKEGQTDRLLKILTSTDSIIDQLDETGLGLLHWAADRGNADILNILLSHGFTVNLQDADGQTALHYAVSCGHIDCVKILLKFGADKCILDNDQQACTDIASDPNILKLLQN